MNGQYELIQHYVKLYANSKGSYSKNPCHNMDSNPLVFKVLLGTGAISLQKSEGTLDI
jgi:hypothetical protein